jgi:hypothetical protein
MWCRDTNNSLNVSKRNKLIVDFRNQRREHTPIHVNGTAVERVSSIKFLGIHITEDLTRTNTTTLVKMAQQRLYFLRRQNTFAMPPQVLSKYYRYAVESILTGCFMAWYGNCFVRDRKALQRVVNIITGTLLPPIQD